MYSNILKHKNQDFLAKNILFCIFFALLKNILTDRIFLICLKKGWTNNFFARMQHYKYYVLFVIVVVNGICQLHKK